MKSYLYNTVLDMETMHNKLVREKEVAYDVETGLLSSPDKVYRVMADVFGLHEMAEEYLYMIALNTKMRLLGFFEISHGTVDSIQITPREIYIRALLTGAKNIIIVHNHPSSDCSPSGEDIECTKRIKDAGGILGINLLDHIIVGRNSYYSLKEKNGF